MTRVWLKASAVSLAAALLFGCAASPQARRDKFLARGKQLMEKKDPGRAVLEFKNAGQATPNDAELISNWVWLTGMRGTPARPIYPSEER